MEQALVHREAIMPLLLMEIEAAAADPAPWIEGDNAPLLFALVLLGHCRVLEAHDTLLRLAALPNDDAEALLDDATTELLPVHLWQTSGGETAGLRWLLDDKTLAHADEQADSLTSAKRTWIKYWQRGVLLPSPRPASAPRGGFRNPFTVISCTGRVFSRRRGSGSSA
ncbi:hypothetical protein BA899_09635 [Spiribacter sp. SSL99]|nr:hypothetical protein BA899_09635 [Spiribacter sp. SSL99]